MSASLEPVSMKPLGALIAAVNRSHGAIGVAISGLPEADVKKGRRSVSPGVYEMWTKNKKKITINTPSDGGLIVSCSREADPDYPV